MSNLYDTLYNFENLRSVHGEAKESVKKILYQLKNINHCNILDLCSGDGRHTIEAAKLGYYVDSIEISKNGVNKILKVSNLKNLESFINCMNIDIREFNFPLLKYNAVIYIDAMHHLNSIDEMNIYLSKIKNSTALNGYNIITTLTNCNIDRIPVDNRINLSIKDINKIFDNNYEDWDYSFLPIKHFEVPTRENNNLSIYSATRAGIIAKKITI